MLAALFKNKPGVLDFPGGIHPPENKDQSTAAPIRPGPVPEELVLPLNMHAGAPAQPVVELDQTVRKGELIAEAHGAISAPVHAPTSGTITAIENRPIQHPSGMSARCIVLRPDGEDRWTELHPRPDWADEDPAELLAHLQHSGLAGLGGAGFPTAVKVNVREKTRVEQLVINAAECEPYITADDRLMRERAPAIIRGVQILAHLVDPDEILIGIEDNKPEAIAALQDTVEGTGIVVRVVPTKYPSGGEKQLIQLLTGKEVPAGGLPAGVGVVCQNVGTAWALQRYLEHGEPLVSRITTLTGDALEYPGNYEVLLGTPVKDLLTFAGVHRERLGKLVSGGPMMGFTLLDPAAPVVKTSNCLIASTPEELPEPPAEQPCIRCGSCAEVCPANLLPQQLYWYSKNDEFERAQHYNLMDCIECGACAYVCPSHIPLVQYYRFAKGEIRNQQAEQAKADRARQRFEARQERIEREKEAKEARRRERREANRKKQEQKAAGGESAGPDLDALKKQMKEASSAYKTAHKEAKTAEEEGREDAAELRQKADELKQKADELKAQVRDAKAGGAEPAPSAGPDLATLKKHMQEANSAYKAAHREAKTAEQEEREDATELRRKADELKQQADELKAQVRDAKAAAPAGGGSTPPPSSSGGESTGSGTGSGDNGDGEDEAEARARKMKELKTAYNKANKQWKQARAAFEKAERDGADNLETLRANVDKLRARADEKRAELDALVGEAKQGVAETTGKDLKTLKKEATEAELGARRKAKEVEQAREAGDSDQAETLLREYENLKRDADEKADHLKKVMEDQGMKEDE